LREALEAKVGLLLTLVAPKPGSINRFSLDSEFEGRVLEALAVLEFIDRAYARGRELAEGRITAQRVGLGGLISSALKSAAQISRLKPIPGLIAAPITLSALKALADQQGRGLRESLRQLILTLLYRSSPEDSLKLVEGLEAVGAARAVEQLEKLGVTRSRISMEALTLGHLYEALSGVDTGFTLNLKDLDRILELSTRISSEKSAIKAVVEAYKSLAYERKLLNPGELSVRSLEEFTALDRKLKARKEELDSLLGGVYIAVTVALLEKWPWM